MGCSSSSSLQNDEGYEDDRGAAGGTPVNSSNTKNEADLAAQMISGDGSLSVRVDLSICCEGLQNLDRGSKSDPFCVVYTKKSSGEQWTEVSRTEIIANSLSPKFVTLVPMTYHFEQVQHLKFEVYDADSSFSKATDSARMRLPEQDFQGSAECVLAEIMGAHQQTWSRPLAGPGGVVTVRGEEQLGQSGDVELRLRAGGLAGGPDAFLRLARVTELGALLPFYKSEVKRGGAGAAAWDPIRATLQVFANGDHYRPVLIELFDWKSTGDHKLIGSCMASINDLQAAVASHQAVPLTHNNSNTGSILVDKCEVKMTPSFLSHVAGGTELLFEVAIDYTASNGDPQMLDSLHNIDPSGQILSPYAQAILGVGGVLQHYDSDKRFPVYGFGGKLGPGQPASHCFAVNGNETEPHVIGINGILQSYYDSLQRVTLSGPTILQKVIRQVAAFSASQPAATDPSQVKYRVLLILTDGMINDMQNTIDAIVQASGLPLSIVIVGVGNADFAGMHKLDADEIGLVSSTGRPAQRDMVQFVPFNRVAGAAGGGTSVAEALAKEVLAEIPRQFMDYMRGLVRSCGLGEEGQPNEQTAALAEPGAVTAEAVVLAEAVPVFSTNVDDAVPVTPAELNSEQTKAAGEEIAVELRESGSPAPPDNAGQPTSATPAEPAAPLAGGPAEFNPDALDLSDMRRFLMNPVAREAGTVRCSILRYKSGGRRLFPLYRVFLEQGNRERFLLAGNKCAGNKTSNYLISMQGAKNLSRASRHVLGNLRANFVDTEFCMYDDGTDPRDMVPVGAGATDRARRELGVVLYGLRSRGPRPRKMQVFVPQVDMEGRAAEVCPTSGREGDMLGQVKRDNLTDLMHLINKPPRWNDKVGGYALNFNGRVTMASVKNFQLVKAEGRREEGAEEEAVLLQFGRVAKHKFTMDLRWPLSPFQAFAISLSSFDS